jgi:hypothetical protein
MTLPEVTGRRVIQVAAIPQSNEHSYGVFALCDDGTIWEAFFNFVVKPPRWDDWEQIPAIPGIAPDVRGGLHGR